MLAKNNQPSQQPRQPQRLPEPSVAAKRPDAGNAKKFRRPSVRHVAVLGYN